MIQMPELTQEEKEQRAKESKVFARSTIALDIIQEGFVGKRKLSHALAYISDAQLVAPDIIVRIDGLLEFIEEIERDVRRIVEECKGDLIEWDRRIFDSSGLQSDVRVMEEFASHFRTAGGATILPLRVHEAYQIAHAILWMIYLDAHLTGEAIDEPQPLPEIEGRQNGQKPGESAGDSSTLAERKRLLALAQEVLAKLS